MLRRNQNIEELNKKCNLLEDLISLKADMHKALEEAHAYTKLYEVDSEWWNFYVGKVDGISSYGYKIQQLIEKHQND